MTNNLFTESIEVELPQLFAIIGEQSDVEAATKAIDTAITMIETVSGVLFNGEDRDKGIKRSDASWLRRAALFQAAWIIEQQDVLSRTAVRSMTQDGLRIDTNTELDLVLAPMSKRALQNCSWSRSGTIAVSTSDERYATDFLTNDNHEWTPMGRA